MGNGDTDDHYDAVAWFKRRLADLYQSVGLPRRAWLRTHGIPKSTMHDLLHSPSRPQWHTVRTFVLACQAYADTSKGQRPSAQDAFDMEYWRSLYVQMSNARRSSGTPNSDTDDRRRLVGIVPALASEFQQRLVARELELTSATAPRCHVLSGLGGVGKTQLAAQLAHRQWDNHEVDLLVWITAESRRDVIAGYGDAFAEITGARGMSDERAAEQFLTWLAASCERRWLVVLDDLATPGDIRGLWPPAVATGRSVVTTRRGDAALAGDGRSLVRVGEFTPEEAHDYLAAKLARRPELAVGAENLAAALGYLPLALAQAVAYQLDRDLSCESYLDRWDEASIETLVPEPEALPDDQTATVAVTWSLSIDLADTLHPPGLARSTLDLLSLLDPHGVPEELFATAGVATYLAVNRPGGGPVLPADVRDALRCLQRLSLIILDRGNYAQILVHAVVQRVTRDRLSRQRLAQAAHIAANALLVAWPAVESDQAVARRLRANAVALGAHAGGLLCEGAVHPLLFRAGQSVGEAGDIRAAVDHFRRMRITATGYLGADHPDVLRLRHDEMYWHGQGGDYAVAAKMADAVVADCSRVLGTDDPLTLTARMYRARWWGMGGEPARAVSSLAELIEDFARVVGADHLDTLSAHNDLAHFRGRDGDAAGAAEAFRSLLADRRRLLGPDHPTPCWLETTWRTGFGRSGIRRLRCWPSPNSSTTATGCLGRTTDTPSAPAAISPDARARLAIRTPPWPVSSRWARTSPRCSGRTIR